MILHDENHIVKHTDFQLIGMFVRKSSDRAAALANHVVLLVLVVIFVHLVAGAAIVEIDPADQLELLQQGQGR